MPGHGLLVGLLALLPVLAEAASPAAASTPAPVTLSTRDRSQVVDVACPQQGAGSEATVQVAREPGATRRLRARVECAPHTQQQGVPVFRVMACENPGGVWQCAPQPEGLRVTLPNDRTLTVFPRAIALPLAIEAVREAAKLTIRPFYRRAIDVMVDTCSIGPSAAGAASGGMSSYEIRCGQAVIYLTRDCAGGQPCRYFIPFAQHY